MLSPEVLEPTPELEPVPATPEVPEPLTALHFAEDARAAAARAVPPGEGGPATASAWASAEPPVGEPPASPPPAEAPPPGQPEQPPLPAQDPPSAEPPITEPPSGPPVIQALVNELEPSMAPPHLEHHSLLPGTYLQTPSGPLWIAAVGKVVAGVQYYEAQTWDGRKVELQEAAGEAAWRLQGESALLSPIRTSGYPLLLERFELNGRYYVITERITNERPMEDALQAA